MRSRPSNGCSATRAARRRCASTGSSTRSSPASAHPASTTRQPAPALRTHRSTKTTPSLLSELLQVARSVVQRLSKSRSLPLPVRLGVSGLPVPGDGQSASGGSKIWNGGASGKGADRTPRRCRSGVAATYPLAQVVDQRLGIQFHPQTSGPEELIATLERQTEQLAMK
jgi:hypothetical protein